MQSSGISSPATPSSNRQQPAGPTRKRFALQGRSATFDPRVDAVRRDLADVRLAERVFAPHYAAPLLRKLARATPLHSTPANGEILTELSAGDAFEVLELSGSHAWGVAPGSKLVGYIDADTLAEI